jgi:protein-disulfide isomerase
MTRNQLTSTLVTGVLVTCAVLITAAVVKREFLPAAAAAAPGPDLQPRKLENAAALAQTGQVMGRPDAPVKIVEFSDFQCPFCARAQEVIENVRRRHPDRVAVVFRHFPLDAIHPHARTAAMASECAAEQGRFHAYHDALFARQDSIGTRAWEAFAGDAGLRDLPAFRQCVDSRRHAAAVERDARVAAELGLEVTPSLIVNGELRPGLPTEEELERWVLAGGR